MLFILIIHIVNYMVNHIVINNILIEKGFLTFDGLLSFVADTSGSLVNLPVKITRLIIFLILKFIYIKSN